MKKTQEVENLEDIDEGIDSLNGWLIVNTLFTILTGLATLILAILSYLKR